MSRVTVIALSVLLFVGVVAAVTIGYLNYANTEPSKPSTSTKAVQEMCQPTDYKEACFKSLSKVNSDDPKELVKAAFESTINELSEVASKSTVLQELEKDPKTADAVKDCKELFQDAIDDLKRSFNEIGEFDFNKVDKMLENLKIWLSATITYQETCLDGFDNTTGDASERVRKILETSKQMSSNGLAIVTEMATLLNSLDMSTFTRRRLLVDDRQVTGHDWFKNRRLLGSTDDTLLEDDEPDRRRKLLSSVSRVEGHGFVDNDFPIWLDARRRKLLEATDLSEDLKAKANVVVAQDGSGKYKTIEEALKEIPKDGNDSFIIYVKEGVYKEYLTLFKWMTHVVLVGDGPTKTKITNNQNFADGVKTFKTATLSVLGDYFMAKDIGVENSAGAIKHQAVALRVQSDQSIFYNCQFDGYQDTLYTHTYRQYYRDCKVTGTIDFIFGDAAAFFQNCTFVIRKPLENQRCIVTAQGRMERHQPTGIIIHKCRFEADPEYYPVRKTNTGYLGRPWKEFSKTVIMESYIDDSIAPEGWLPWEGTFALDTCYYGEYNNMGPGSDMSKRVTWRGIKTIDYGRAERLMPVNLYGNDDWIRVSHVPYDPTLDSMAPGPAPGIEEGQVSALAQGQAQGQPSSSILSSYFPGISSSSSSSSAGGSSSGASTSASGSSPNGSSSGGSSSSPFASITSWFGGGSSPSGSSSDASSSGASPAGGASSSGSPSGDSSASGSSASGSSSSGGSSADGSSAGGSSSSGGSSAGGSSSGGSSSDGSSSGGSSASGSSSGGSSSGGSSTGTGSGSSASGSSSGGADVTTASVSGSGSGGATGETSTGTPSTTTATTTEGGAPVEAPEPSASEIEAPAPSPTSADSPAPTTSAADDTTTETETASAPTSTQTNEAATTSTPTSSPSSSPTKQTGPITVRELERILMTNEEMGEHEDTANDDMSGNVPDGDEPGPAMVPVAGPTSASASASASAPTPTQDMFVTPAGSPSESGPSASPSQSPSDEVGDWLPPATAPAPEMEPADKVPPTPAPHKSNGVRSVEGVFSGLVLWAVALAM